MQSSEVDSTPPTAMNSMIRKLFGTHGDTKEIEKGGKYRQSGVADNDYVPYVARSLAYFLDRLVPSSGIREQIDTCKSRAESVDNEKDLKALLDAIASLISSSKAEAPERNRESASSSDQRAQAADPQPINDNQTQNRTSKEGLPSVHEVLIDLIQRLEFPADLGGQVNFLIDQFFEGIPAEKVASSVAAVADLVVEARLKVEREKKEIERFLEQLTEQLHDLDKYLTQSKEVQQEAAQLRNEFDSRMDDHVREIKQSVDAATDLDLLKSSLRTRLDTIHHYLEEDQRREVERARQTEEEIERLTSKLEQMEQETDSLRERIEQERELALRDPLTGLFNRLAYDERIAHEFARWKRYKRPLSIAIFDLDHFKQINDRYGHKAGDKVLKLVAELFQNQIRETDFIARYGGEEFVLIMTEAEIENARTIVDKLRRSAAACNFHYHGTPVSITLSCGFTSLRQGDTPGLTFERADKALYRAKAEGRNCCCED